MTEKNDYTGKIRGKGLAGTGITEQILGKHHRAKGGRVMIVASASVAAIHEDVGSGTGGVDYVLDDLEIAPAPAEEHVRELIRSFHYERRLEEEGPGLDDDGLTPKIGDAVAAGQQHAPHPFLPTDAAEEAPDCEVCGLGPDAGPHRAWRMDHPDDDQGDASGPADPFEPVDDTNDDEVADRTQPEELPVT